jgi:hypothetical protein
MTVHTLHTLNGQGDVNITWNPRNADEVREAKRTFDNLKKKGYQGARVQDGERSDELIREFDPQARSIVMFQQIQGG